MKDINRITYIYSSTMKQKVNYYGWLRVGLVLLMTVASVMSLMAREVTEREAEDKAKRFFVEQTLSQGQARTAASLTVKRVMPSPRAARVAPASVPTYYIYNVEGGNAFVVIAGETDVPEVLAYSLEGNFHPEYWDKGAGLFLDSYDEQISLVRSGELKAEAPAVTDVTPILLITAEWDQDGAYFNDYYAPQWRGESCISGCVATAMAEVMQYHKWPLVGRGSHSYITTTHSIYLKRDFYNETYNWNLMPSYVPSGSYESDAVSRLMLDCGVAVEADYGTLYEETGAYVYRVAQSLRDYFYYDNPRYLMRSWTETSDWKRANWNGLILEELQQGRPVILGGTSRLTGGGHCFLADGVNSQGVFHYNMGWSGINNGYYTDGNISSNKYKMDEAVIGIKPLDTSRWRMVSPFTFATLETYSSIEVGKSFTLYYDYLTNISPDAFSGSLRVEMRDRYDALKVVLSTKQASSVSSGSYWKYLGFSCTIPSGVTIDEGDRLWLYTSSDNGLTWLPVIVGDKDQSTLLLKERIHFDLTLGDNKHGSVSCLVNGQKVTSAVKNDAVVIRVMPDAGYSVSAVKVKTYTETDAFLAPVLKDEVEVTYDMITGTWKFTMPESDVWINVEYTGGTGVINVYSNESMNKSDDFESPFYDLMGRRLQKKPANGYYIQNGKKYLVK